MPVSTMTLPARPGFDRSRASPSDCEKIPGHGGVSNRPEEVQIANRQWTSTTMRDKYCFTQEHLPGGGVMTSHLPKGISDQMLHRIFSEYLEMPGLRLTRRQAQRLWGLDEETCA